MSLCVCVSSWQNVVLETPLAGTNSPLEDSATCPPLCLWTDFCQHDNVTHLQLTVTQLHRLR